MFSYYYRPSFYARRFKQFMGEKVFRKIVGPIRSGPSMRRANLKRAMSKENEQGDTNTNQDSGVASEQVPKGLRVIHHLGQIIKKLSNPD